MPRITKEQFEKEPVKFVINVISEFVRTSALNRMPPDLDGPIFDAPVVQFADGDDPIFARYKTIIAPTHLTPREALAKAYGKNESELPKRLSVISWVLPITEKTRKSNRPQTTAPSKSWSYTRWQGEEFHAALQKHVVKVLTDAGYLAVTPVSQPYFKRIDSEKGPYSNWSERHIAFAAGLGSFSLSDGFITEHGIAMRVGSVVTDLALPPSPRTSDEPYSNCLFYVNKSCRVCIDRCPGSAISEKGHDKVKCQSYVRGKLGYLLTELKVGNAGCGLCQTKVPCEAANPTRKLKKKAVSQ